MLKQFIIKEWKERIAFLVLALLLFTGLAAFQMSGKKEIAGMMAVGLLTFVLPFLGALVGSSAFTAEFKSDAWVYLFSRPVRKWAVWLIKYFAQLSILMTLFGAYLLLIEAFPGIKDILETNSPRMGGNELSLFSTSLLFSISAFTIAFSISFLSEKQLIIFFVVVLIGIGLGLTYGRYLEFLIRTYPQIMAIAESLKKIWLLTAASFAIASILTFVRADFSQQLRKIWLFAKYAVLFLALSVVISSAWTLHSARSGKTRRVRSLEISGGAAYFDTDRGIYRFDPERGSVKKFIRSGTGLSAWDFSIGGGKLATVKYKVKKEGKRYRVHPELWLVNLDGRGRKEILKYAWPKDSPFYDQWIWPWTLTPDGKKIVFVTRDKKSKESSEHLMWMMDIDGTGLKRIPVEFPGVMHVGFAGWTSTGQDILLLTHSRHGPGESDNRLLKVGLDSGSKEVLAEDLRNPYATRVSPSRDAVVFIAFDPQDGKDVLLKVHLSSCEKEEIFRGTSFEGYCWSGDGERIAFLAEKSKLGIYSAKKKAVLHMRSLAPSKQPSPAASLGWVSGDRKLASRDHTAGSSSIRIFGPDLSQEKIIRIPFSPGNTRISTLDDWVFVIDANLNRLWGVKVATEEWLRLY